MGFKEARPQWDELRRYVPGWVPAFAFSGHWLIFYAMPAIFFTFVPADARPAISTHDPVA